MKLGDIITATNMHYGLQVGKSLNLLIFGLGVYADAGMDASTIDVSYNADITDPSGNVNTVPINFSLSSDSGMRYGVGFFLKPIPLVHISAEYAQTPTNQIATIGLTIGMR